MCFYNYGDGPEVYRESNPVARKTYQCCECHGEIKPGECYTHVWGVWVGRAETFRTCRRCAWNRTKVRTIEMLHGCAAEDSDPLLGELRCAFANGDYGVMTDAPDWFDFQEVIPLPKYEMRAPVPRNREWLVAAASSSLLGRGYQWQAAEPAEE